MKQFFSDFLQNEDGAITVDFVVLTAAICTLGLIIVVTFTGGATGLANDVEAFLGNVEVP